MLTHAFPLVLLLALASVVLAAPIDVQIPPRVVPVNFPDNAGTVTEHGRDALAEGGGIATDYLAYIPSNVVDKRMVNGTVLAYDLAASTNDSGAETGGSGGATGHSRAIAEGDNTVIGIAHAENGEEDSGIVAEETVQQLATHVQQARMLPVL